MNSNPYLAIYSQTEVEALISSGSIVPDIDSSANLIIELVSGSLYSSSITIPLQNVPVDPIKVQTKYDVSFSEL
jgi:hypothetical protein